MAYKHKSSDADNSDMPQSCKVFPLSEKVCMYVQKKHSVCRVHRYAQFQESTEDLGTYLP